MIQTKIRQLLSLILVLLGIGFSSFCFQSETEIEWSSDRKLTWEDFKGSIPANYGKKGAETSSGISTGKYNWNENKAKVKVYAYFSTSESWTRLQGDELALKHEQGHFDITEIYARKLRSIVDNKKFKRSSFTKCFHDIYNKNEAEKNAYQLLYDKETNHHINREKQLEWDNKIAEELQALEKYKNTEVTIILKGK